MGWFIDEKGINSLGRRSLLVVALPALAVARSFSVSPLQQRIRWLFHHHSRRTRLWGRLTRRAMRLTLLFCLRAFSSAFLLAASPRRRAAGSGGQGRNLHDGAGEALKLKRTGDDPIENSSFQVRSASYDDLPRVAELMTDCFYPGLNAMLRPVRYLMELDRLQSNFPYDEIDRHYYLCVFDSSAEDCLVGFCDIDGRILERRQGLVAALSPLGNVRRPQPYLSDLAVNSSWRRKGVAKTLMSKAERLAGDMGFEELYLGVNEDNHLALQMYSNMGYEEIQPQGHMIAFLDVQKEKCMRMLRREIREI